MHGILHTLSFLLINFYHTHANDNEYDLEISKDVAAISKLAIQHSRIDPVDLNFGSKLLSELKSHEISPNTKSNYLPLDPVPEDPWVCKRDFTNPCPMDFVLLTNTTANTSNTGGKCVPKSTYTGSCGAEDFAKTSVQYKLRWASLCETNWPCDGDYRPDYGHPCPELWTMKGGKCAPTYAYIGPCDQSISFAHFNKRQREEWSRRCHAFWPNYNPDMAAPSNHGNNKNPYNVPTDIPIDSKNTHTRLFR